MNDNQPDIVAMVDQAIRGARDIMRVLSATKQEAIAAGFTDEQAWALVQEQWRVMLTTPATLDYGFDAE